MYILNILKIECNVIRIDYIKQVFLVLVNMSANRISVLYRWRTKKFSFLLNTQIYFLNFIP